MEPVVWLLDFGVGVFHEFFLIISLGRATAGAHCKEELRPLNRSIERGIPMGFCHSTCRFGCMRVCFDREFEFGFL